MLQEKQTWYVYSSSLCVWFALISLYTGEPSGISKLGPTLVKILRKYICVEKIPLNSWGSNDDYNLWTSLRWLYWFLSTLGIQVSLDTLKHAKIDCYGFILIILSLLNNRYDDNFLFCTSVMPRNVRVIFMWTRRGQILASCAEGLRILPKILCCHRLWSAVISSHHYWYILIWYSLIITKNSPILYIYI